MKSLWLTLVALLAVCGVRARLLPADELPADELPAVNMTVRTNIVESVLEYVESATEHVADKYFDLDWCVYGLNCGEGCESDDVLEDDDLDAACYYHDICLKEASDAGAKCECHDTLRAAAVEIGGITKCSWWEIWCVESDMVRTAPSIVLAMDIQKGLDKC